MPPSLPTTSLTSSRTGAARWADTVPPAVVAERRNRLRDLERELAEDYCRGLVGRRLDVLVGNNGGPPVLLRNNAGQGNHWLGVKLEGVKCNRDAVGARP